MPADCARSVTVASRSALTDLDFGSRTGRGAVGGTVFEDHDGDLTRDGADGGVADVTVYVDSDDDGAYDDGEPRQTTDAAGAYRFAGLPEGEHAIRIQTPPNWLCLTPACRLVETVADHDELTGRDFAIARAASIGGSVFDDRDADGDRDATDPGREGIVVWVDLDDDGTIDDGEPQATTDAAGDYVIAGIGPGTWTVRIVAGDGWTCSAPSECSDTLTITSGQTLAGADFATWTAGDDRRRALRRRRRRRPAARGRRGLPSATSSSCASRVTSSTASRRLRRTARMRSPA